MGRTAEPNPHKAQNSEEVRVAGFCELGTGSVGNRVTEYRACGPPKDQLTLPAVLGVGVGNGGLSSCKLASVFSLFLLWIPRSLLRQWATLGYYSDPLPGPLLFAGQDQSPPCPHSPIQGRHPGNICQKPVSSNQMPAETRGRPVAFSSPKAWPLCLWLDPQRTAMSPAGVCLGLQKSMGLLLDMPAGSSHTLTAAPPYGSY